MGTFVDMAVKYNDEREPSLVAIFKGYTIHIAVDDEQELMKASSRFQPSRLNRDAAVPKTECWRAINAWARVENQIRNDQLQYSDLKTVDQYDYTWIFKAKP
jgi:hypothetical protein